MSFDTVLEEKVGVLGRWQIFLFLLINSPGALFPSTMIPQLANLSPPYVCSGPWFEGWTYNDVLNTSRQIATLQVDNQTAPPDFKCQRYDLSGIQKSIWKNASMEETQRAILSLATAANLSLERCAGPWLFDSANAPYRVSLIESFDMVCHQWYLIPKSAVCYVIGRCIGMAAGGQFGDRFGRRTVICVAYPLSSIVAMLAFLCSRAFLIFLLRFALGLTVGLAVSSSNVYFYELTNHRHRNTLNVIAAFCFIFGQNLVVLTSYLLQDWRWMHFVYGVVILLCSILNFIFLPESPRWLVAKKRYNQALKIMRKAVLMNGGTTEVAASISQKDLELTTDTSDSDDQRGGLRDWIVFFVSPQSIKRWLPLSVVWIVIGEIYYGISFYGVRLQGNPYLIAFGMSFSAFPSMFVEWILFEKLDRKRPLIGLIGFMCACTIGALVAKATDGPGWIAIVFATLIFTTAGALFDMVYLVTPELFPTLYRANALGFLAAICRIGVIGGMYAERLEGNWPLIIFSATSGVAVVCSLLLPRGDYKTMTEGRLETRRRRGRDSEAAEEVVMVTRSREDSK